MRASVQTRVLWLVVSVALSTATAPAGVATASVFSCTDVHAVYATGANNAPAGPDFDQFVNDLHGPNGRIAAPVTFSQRPLGGDGGYAGFQYQPTDSAALFVQGLIGFGPYEDSVRTGVDELEAYLTDRAAECGNEVYVLGGWSEGADVIGTALFELPENIRARIAFVALFGDPRLDAGNQASLLDPPIPWACLDGQPIWMRGDSGCATSMGIFGARRPYLPSDIEGRVGSWCRKNDAACTGSYIDILPSVSIEPFTHHRYFDPNAESAMAAQEAATRLQAFVPAHPEAFDVSLNQFVDGQAGADLAFVIDTTGSMWGAIDDVKSGATALAQLWTSLFHNGRVALIEFKDQGDPFVARVDLGLTSDAGAFQTSADALTADGGGDTPEAQLSGLMTALDGLEWRDGATKAAIVITDAAGKDPEPVTNFTRGSVIQHSREIDPVAIYGVNVTGDQTVTDWIASMAAATAGEVVTPAPGQSLTDALADLLETAHANPVARLDGPIYANVSDTITFNAGDSFSASSTIASYNWDFDGDSVVDQTTTAPTTSHTYSADFHGIASVDVVDADGRSAMATADVTIDSAGLTPLLPLAPITVSASVTGTDQVTVTWTPASSDRADAYKVFIADGSPVRFTDAGDPDSVVINAVDLSQSQTFRVAASNAYGNSAGTAAPPVGGTSAWSPSAIVNADDGLVQIVPVAAIAPDGMVHAAWVNGWTSPTVDLRYANRNPASGAWSTPELIGGVSTPGQFSPALATDSAGDLFAIWTDTRVSGDRNVYFSKRSVANGLWSSSVRVNDDPTNKHPAQADPAIAVGPTGEAIAIWEDSRGNKDHIYAARLPAGSSTWSANMKVSSVSSTKGGEDVAIGADGTAYAVWFEPKSGDANIWLSTLAPGATSWAAPVKVSDDPGTSYQGAPQVAVDGTGRVMVIWQDWRANPFQLRARLRDAGGSWQPSVVVAADGANTPSLAMRSDGVGFVAWYDGINSTTPRLNGSSFNPSAGAWSGIEEISDPIPADGNVEPAVVLGSDSIFVVYQNAHALQGGGNEVDIVAKTRAGP